MLQIPELSSAANILCPDSMACNGRWVSPAPCRLHSSWSQTRPPARPEGPVSGFWAQRPAEHQRQLGRETWAHVPNTQPRVLSLGQTHRQPTTWGPGEAESRHCSYAECHTGRLISHSWFLKQQALGRRDPGPPCPEAPLCPGLLSAAAAARLTPTGGPFPTVGVEQAAQPAGSLGV